MSLSDDPTSPTKKNQASTSQEPRESPQDSSFLQSMETKMSPSDNPTSPTEKNRAGTSQDPRESPQDNSFLSSKEPHETSRSLKSRHGSFSENPNYFGGSLDSAGNMGSQTYSGYANNGQSYLGVEPSNNSVGLRIRKPQQMSKSSVIGVDSDTWSTKALQLPYDNLERLGMEGDNSSSVTEWRSSSRKRKDEEGEEQGDDKDEDASNLKKPRFVWSRDLKEQFVAAVNQLGGAESKKAVPKNILEQMNVPAGLTRKTIASHLQKYREKLRELGGVSQHQGSQDTSNLKKPRVDWSVGLHQQFVAAGQLPTEHQAAGLGQPAMVSKSGLPDERSIFSFDNSKTRFGEQQSQPQPQMNLLQGVPTGLQQQMSNSSAIGVDSDTLFADSTEYSQLQAYENYPRRLGLEGYGTNNEPTLMNVEGSNVSENYPRRLGLEGYLDSAGSKKPINTDDEEVLKRYGSYRDNPNYYNDDNILLDNTNTLNPSGDMFEEFRQQEIMVIEVSQLSREGQVRAIQEWGLPQSRLTHLVFCITPRSNMPPGLDHYLATLLNIRHSFLHLEYQQGWFDERTAIRLFRDFARENHNDHPALVLLSEVTTPMFREVLRMT